MPLWGFTFALGWFEEVSREEHRGLQLLGELVANVLESRHPGSREVERVEDVDGQNCGDRSPLSSIPQLLPPRASSIGTTVSKPTTATALTDDTLPNGTDFYFAALPGPAESHTAQALSMK